MYIFHNVFIFHSTKSKIESIYNNCGIKFLVFINVTYSKRTGTKMVKLLISSDNVQVELASLRKLR